MFSRAIRQSSRRVAAISATGRIASVSPSQPPAIAPSDRPAIAASSQNRYPMPLAPQWGFVDGTGRAALGGKKLPSAESTVLTGFLYCRPALPRSPMPSAPTPPMRRPPPPRSLPSLSRGSAASRRRTASPRLDVCFPSGTPHRHRKPQQEQGADEGTVTVLPVSTA
jgi:hypothetical protein